MKQGFCGDCKDYAGLTVRGQKLKEDLGVFMATQSEMTCCDDSNRTTLQQGKEKELQLLVYCPMSVCLSVTRWCQVSSFKVTSKRPLSPLLSHTAFE